MAAVEVNLQTAVAVTDSNDGPELTITIRGVPPS
jgi:hypothetical protein